jgi:purine-nucleoside phosphorylase
LSEAEAAARVVRDRLAGRAPSIAVVLGSGLGPLARRIEAPVRIPYLEIPHFPPPTVAGHAGELLIGELGGKTVVAQSGRFHQYEGHSAATAALPVRVFRALGVDTLILTNAAGGIRRSFSAGTLMLIADHLNLTGRNPLVGPVAPGVQRFPDLTVAYDAGLRTLAREAAARLGIPLEEGVYAGLLGPSYETPAEIRMLERLGADAVGMSTVLEVIAARAAGIRCLGFSTITNPAAGRTPEPLSHAEVVETGARMSGWVGQLIEEVVRRVPARPA